MTAMPVAEPMTAEEYLAADEVLAFRRSKPDAPSFDVALELTHDETLSSPLLPGFAVALDAL